MKLLVDEYDSPPRHAPPRTGEPDDGRHEVENQGGQIVHGAIITS
jgi:hypothetical protein